MNRLTLSRLVRLTFFTHFIVGAVVLIRWMTKLFVYHLAPTPVVAPFYEWSRFFNFPEKQAVLLAFVAVSCALSLYAVAWAWVLNRFGSERLVESVAHDGFIDFVAPFACSWTVQIVGLVLVNHRLEVSLATTIGCAIGWGLIVFGPLVFRAEWSRQHAERLHQIEIRLHRVTSVVMLASSGAIVAWMFVPVLTQDLRLLNDQLTAPEQTILSTGLVNNPDYIRQHSIYGLQMGSATMGPEDTATKRASYEFPVRMNRVLEEHLRAQQAIEFDPTRGRLTLFTAFNDIDDFQQMMSSLESPTERESLQRLRFLTNQERQYSQEEDEFIDKNWLELKWQMLNRWAIHHHNFVYGPMNELSLGKAPSSISFQYGYVNAVALIGLTKLLGGFTLENYFRADLLFYPLYLALLLWSGQKIVRDRGYTALLAVIALASMLALDYEKIIRAPGLSPLRHFLDVPVIGLMVWYWRDKYRRAMLGAYALSLLEIALNREFGLVLLGALLAVEVLQVCEEGPRRRRFELLCAAGSLLVAGGMLVSLRSITNYMSQYYAAGFVSPPLAKAEFTTTLVLFAIVYGEALWVRSIDQALRKAMFLLAFYCNGLYLYYVWGASPPHFQNLEPVYALLAVVGLKAALSYPRLKPIEQKVVTVAQIGAAAVLLIPAAIDYRNAQVEFDDVFKTHVVHSWTFPRVHAKSTIDPKPFEQAVSLIQTYEPSTKGIYLVSVFDNLLPIVADRYSAMPFFDLAWFLLSDNEVAIARQRIVDQKPQHLFVDHDILYDHSGEVADWHLRRGGQDTHVESVLRIRRLQVLQDLFRQVSGDYVKVAESPLIDVYERRPL